jgi:predicted ferric reductase
MRAEAGRLPGLSGKVLAGLYLLLVLAPLALALASGIDPDRPWGEAASALGMAALVMLGLQFFTSGRFRVLSGRVGIDRTIAFHAFAARALLVAVVLHPFLYAVPALTTDISRGIQVIEMMFTSERNRSGLVAWIAVIAIVLLAILRDRLRIPYEIWRASHALLGAVALVAGLMHAFRAGTYTEEPLLRAFWIGLGVAALSTLAVVYVWRTIAIRRDPWRLVENKPVARGLWELSFRRESGEPFEYRAGQFVWLVTQPRLFPLYDHPFSIASSPRDEDVKLIVKEVGDYTNTIGALSLGTRAGLDGPHGNFVEQGREAQAVLLVAGGAGIAPILGILRDLDRAGDERSIRLIVAVGSADRLVGREEIEEIATRLDLQAHFLVEEAGPDWNGSVGRVERALLERVTRDLPAEHTLALICGPTVFMTLTADWLLDLGFAPGRIHYERFDYDEGALSRIDRAERRRQWALAAAIAAAAAAFALRG